jgi:hypothetical protein
MVLQGHLAGHPGLLENPDAQTIYFTNGMLNA